MASIRRIWGNKAMRLLIIFAGLLAIGHAKAQNSLDYPSAFRCDTSKFNWYCDLDEERQSRATPTQAPPMPQAQNSPAPQRIETKDIKTAEQMRVELKRREDVAVMNPTDQNLRDYLELWQIAQEKGSVFADSWRRVVWTNPDLDYSLRRPTNNSAIKVQEQIRNVSEDQHLKELAKAHGLIFFFRSDCPYCHAMAPTLKSFSEKYGIEVLPVSIDGGGLPDFPNPRDGRVHAQKWGVERVPALFIGSKETGDKAPIGFGMMSLAEIVNRMFVLTGTKPGQSF